MHVILQKVKNSPDIFEQFSKLRCQTECHNTEVITFVNPFSYLQLREELQTVEQVDAIYSDAISSAKLFSRFFNKEVPRLSFDLGSFARHFLEEANKHGFPLYIIGAKPEEIEKTVHIFQENYPGINIVGYRDGYFSNDNEVVDSILRSGAEFVICGLGSPRQDQFSVLLKEKAKGQIKQIYTCGGFLHQSSEKVQYYPTFINKYNLRWLYRIFDNGYVLKRLLKDYPIFFFLIFKDLKVFKEHEFRR
ncbi:MULTISPECIES: WecB/TagA/CpsF family glycosyltransferase [unclassified Pseudoalteromonas]|uniref:WecB/TagA/CpsF family glycosyltransferase n=1 Tax=unclassified Pseudoalteromonas TaxID=194690 RepID=UPI001B3A2EAF|nr:MULTISPECIES: WecB/TagA/CpsF family glycosyltransferase [unclassified Pseudoalteromonas]MBQ4844358.1 WecB/TagA/CpsF family glycosyltransferase [Pseudoalteromonas sp. MMG005]MBQ4849227.1 WecB/TagA/CpsF family glycosyltransferase [Pseudoalteromonas sp. MMG012]